MREILFRGKRVGDRAWVFGFLIKYPESILYDGDSPYFIRMPPADPDDAGSSYNVDPATVGQYTGLTDKHGVKIFEGDIVCYQFDMDDCPFPNKNTKKRCGRVFFSEWRSSFSVTARGMSDMVNNDLFKYVRNGNRVEVIGNIYDNPELLEGTP